jgi:cyclohexa-1,5-dienecarbonyl-CoA hydratase
MTPPTPPPPAGAPPPAGPATASTVHLARDGRCATITIDRPPLNVLDIATIEALDAALATLAADSGLAVVVVTGAGGRAFSAGVAVEDHTRDKVATMLRGFHRALTRLWQLEAVTVAAVDGHCLGGGMELAAVCDVVVASRRSKFGQPEVKLGCYPPVAAALYPRLIGQARTVELLTSGRLLETEEAARLGFVHEVVDPAADLSTATSAPSLLPGSLAPALAARVAARVGELSALSTPVLRLTKRAIRAADGGAFEAALATAERIYLEQLVALDDLVEGTEAFLARRPPVWQHR